MSFKDVLRTAFPFISLAASMGGPIGVMAANAVGKALEIDKVDGNTEGITNALNAALTTNPDAMLKLQEAENMFKLQMAQMGIDSIEKMAELDNADRSNARSREIAVRDHTPTILAYVVVGFTLVLEGYIIMHGIPAGVDGVVLGRILGTFDTSAAAVLLYYFGSSVGSRNKDAANAAAMQIISDTTDKK